MADENSKLFTDEARKRLRSPDDLDEYVRVTNPSVWIVLGACAALMIGLFAWGFFGTAETDVSALGTRVKGEVLCFLTADKVSDVHEGDPALVDGEPMTVASISTVPVSPIEARALVGGDFLATTLVGDSWTYVVRLDDDVEPAFAEGIPLSVTITTDRVPPIRLVFKDGADG